MLVHILDVPSPRGERVERDVDDRQLVKTAGVHEDDHERTTWVEYRFPGSDVVVHRSVHVTLKRWPQGMVGEVQSLT